MDKSHIWFVVIGFLITAMFFGGCSVIKSVSPGTEEVGVLFGEVTGTVLGPGLHFPVNPLMSWDTYDTKERSVVFEDIRVPASDQQTAEMDISVQVRILPGAGVTLRKEVGTQSQAESVHFIPIVRGALRDAGRSTKKVEEFFYDSAIQRYRDTALARIQEELAPKGFEVTDVIVRDVELPAVIRTAIESKKKREQEVEQERAELDRIALQAQQEVKKAEARESAAVADANATRTAADAEAYKIRLLQEQLSRSPQYIELVKAKRWNGVLPRVSGSNDLLIDLRN